MRKNGILGFKLAVTTKEELRCHSKGCRRNLTGSGGYVKINFLGRAWYDKIRINLCRNCFDKYIKDYERDKKTIWRKYRKLQRRLLIGKLKK